MGMSMSCRCVCAVLSMSMARRRVVNGNEGSVRSERDACVCVRVSTDGSVRVMVSSLCQGVFSRCLNWWKRVRACCLSVVCRHAVRRLMASRRVATCSARGMRKELCGVVASVLRSFLFSCFSCFLRAVESFDVILVEQVVPLRFIVLGFFGEGSGFLSVAIELYDFEGSFGRDGGFVGEEVFVGGVGDAFVEDVRFGVEELVVDGV